MLDTQLLRNDIEKVAENLANRGFNLDVEYFTKIEEKRKTLQTKTQELQTKRNLLSKNVGQLKQENKDATNLINEVNKINEELNIIEKENNEIQSELNAWLLTIPNITHKDTPIGKNENDNLEIKKVGIPTQFNFTPKDHVDIAEKFGLNMKLGVELSGSRFYLMQGKIAKLHRSIAQFMLNTHTTRHGYTECYTPYIVNPEILIGTGQLPKFAEDMYKVLSGEKESKEQYLISTAEIALTNMVREKILKLDDLPIKLTAHTPCFRSEAGSYGKDTKGIIRVHQFDKVELVHIAHPEESYKTLEELLANAEYILQALELPYRVITLCTGDIGFSSAKTYDIEVWMPSQNTYREISSCSNCEDFQARRMRARFKDADGKNKYVHTLNGSGLAVGRTLAAIIENYQDENGNIKIPKVLQPFFNNENIITNKI